MRARRGWFLGLVTVLSLIGSTTAPLAAAAQTPEPTPESDPVDNTWLHDTMSTMTTADKVGQLFLVSFEGTDTSSTTDIARLVQVLRIGGVVVLPENDNFRNEPSAPQDVQVLTTSLQGLAFSASAPVTVTRTVPVTVTVSPELGEGEEPGEPEVLVTEVTLSEVVTYPAQDIPLFVASFQEGDAYPYTALRSGFTELPSSMALGATWNEGTAETVGQIVGRELSAVGINLLLGPSLDVLREPRPGLSDHLSTRVFGGDPYWAGRMGQSYIRGVHLGSAGRVATVAKHLPGLGASDRSLEEEVATVDKSLQDLRLIELPPFIAVTHSDAITDTADALMTAHIRYRGFQGNIRYVTPPISLHAQGMEQIMGLPELADWRLKGGVLVSDSLGVPAIRRYYAPEQDSFPNRQIALDAFLAGNDLLTLTRFSLDGAWESQIANIEDTIAFFQNRYEEDESFRTRVDGSVRRILSMKRRICPEFALQCAAPDGTRLNDVGGQQATIAQIAQQSVTLLYPSADELALRMPRAPRLDEDILVFTDAQTGRDCAACAPFTLVEPQSIGDTMLQLYGPDASGQISPDQIVSMTFAELQSYFDSGTPDLGDILRDADWIIFAMLGYDPEGTPSSGALKQFLKEPALGAETQKLIVLAYEAPYYLDTTEVSKLTAYYALYSKTPVFIETSVRALFSEFGLAGRSPVTVEGVGYDLVRQLAPDPGQTIAVMPEEQPSSSSTTGQPLSLQVGDSLQVRSSVVLDRNGNPVPDGTPVLFRYIYQGEGLGGQAESTTVNGVANATITLEREGELQITATSDPATSSRPLVVRLYGDTAEILTPTPTSTPTPTPTPTATPTPTFTATPTATPEPTPVPPPEPEPPPPPEPRVLWVDLALGLLGALAAGSVILLIARRAVSARRDADLSLRLALCGVATGLGGYLFYGLGLPGSAFLEGITPGLRGLAIGFACGLFPLVALAWLGGRSTQETST